ncbi:cupin domain-containing protein [Yersinia sp. 2544 StPb PI]|uniref:Cupin superfamily protein n=2 Tax=Yersiniaceae TaxID=1903411 RepID=A0A0T9J7X4_YERPU|nr:MULTISPECIES: cupin domain-containing protein [Yersinia]PSH22918.1 hypothetical protein B7R74_04905 [Yersinia pseudotuberculosis]CNC02147.1 Cupin superfamily protein [Yersinia pseudotuberculosis]CNF69613.1 Cupin superfamily protein [Yersinia mollaretii]CNI28139.1 Cupin superfamily protein [Yersinia bercovieri]CQJ32979.1 Cupin superfamily protein [Yersinia mollaretii]
MDNTQMTLTLASLLGPDQYKAFLGCFSRNTVYRGRMPKEVAGTILTLDGLQDIINTRRLSFPRCRLVRVGKPLNPVEYNARSHSALGEPVMKLIPDRVMKELRDGATLVLDFVEDLSSKVRHIAEAIATEFQEKTGATVFFSTGGTKGFTTHWDDSDTLIFQLSGRKKWDLWTPDFLFPVTENKSRMSPPEGPPAESLILKSNDFLYLPRGHWHAPEPSDSHSLHISFAFRRRNGIDFIKSLLPLLSEHPALRMDIDKQASAEQQDIYILQLQQTIASLVSAENLGHFLKAAGERQFVSETIAFGKFS